jgi:hypothetical protein
MGKDTKRSPRTREVTLAGAGEQMTTPRIIVIDNLSETIFDWQKKLINSYPSISFYPYSDLIVAGANTMVFVVCSDVNEINEDLRTKLVHTCAGYGLAHALKVVPPVDVLQRRWLNEAKTFKPKA